MHCGRCWWEANCHAGKTTPRRNIITPTASIFGKSTRNCSAVGPHSEQDCCCKLMVSLFLSTDLSKGPIFAELMRKYDGLSFDARVVVNYRSQGEVGSIADQSQNIVFANMNEIFWFFGANVLQLTHIVKQLYSSPIDARYHANQCLDACALHAASSCSRGLSLQHLIEFFVWTVIILS